MPGDFSTFAVSLMSVVVECCDQFNVSRSLLVVESNIYTNLLFVDPINVDLPKARECLSSKFAIDRTLYTS